MRVLIDGWYIGIKRLFGQKVKCPPVYTIVVGAACQLIEGADCGECLNRRPHRRRRAEGSCNWCCPVAAIGR